MLRYTRFKYEVHVQKFPKIGHSGIILFMCVGEEDKHKYLQYEVSITVYVDRGSKSKFKNYKSESVNI